MTADNDPLDPEVLLRDDVTDADFQIPATPPAPIVNWATLTDTEARAEWQELREWVAHFTVRYNIPESTVPACWYEHGALVEELSALRTAHVVAFDSPGTGFGPSGWHDHLALAMPRLRDAYYGQCSRGHDPSPPRTWTNVTDENAWDAWINQTHA